MEEEESRSKEMQEESGTLLISAEMEKRLYDEIPRKMTNEDIVAEMEFPHCHSLEERKNACEMMLEGMKKARFPTVTSFLE